MPQPNNPRRRLTRNPFRDAGPGPVDAEPGMHAMADLNEHHLALARLVDALFCSDPETGSAPINRRLAPPSAAHCRTAATGTAAPAPSPRRSPGTRMRWRCGSSGADSSPRRLGGTGAPLELDGTGWTPCGAQAAVEDHWRGRPIRGLPGRDFCSDSRLLDVMSVRRNSLGFAAVRG